MSNRRSHELLSAISLALVASCTLESADTTEVEVAPASESLQLSRGCNDKFEDIYTKPNSLPSYNRTRRGDVVRCAVYRPRPRPRPPRKLKRLWTPTFKWKSRSRVAATSSSSHPSSCLRTARCRTARSALTRATIRRKTLRHSARTPSSAR
jgi:hypothetical protein